MSDLHKTEHFDETAELSLEVIKQRAVKGVLALTGRTFFLQLVALSATFALTVFLDPKEYGVFFLVSAIVNIFTYFSDIGFSAAAIQKKEKLDNDELTTTFTIQQGLVIGLVVIIFAATPIIKNIYNFSDESVYLLWALSISLVFSSLKTIPSVLLERRLEFNKLIIPQIVEVIAFYGIAVLLAWKGFGVASFTIAVLVRSILGLFTIYIIQPWMPKYGLSKNAFRGLIKFGLPYQLNIFLAVLKDDGMVAVLGSILGPGGVGLLGWAQKWGFAPLRFFMDQVIKVTFPAFSRLQDNPLELSKAVSRSISFISILVFPSLVGLILTAPILVRLIPKYGKWEPALFALSLICFNAFWAAVTTPLTNVLNAIGKIGITFKLMIMWTVLTLVFVPGLALLYGLNGAVLGYSIVGLSSVIAIIIANKFIKVNFYESVFKPLFASLVMGVVIFLTQVFMYENVLLIVVMILLGLLTYVTTLFIIAKDTLTEDAKKVFTIFRSKKVI
ncbi:oligosaccharide flippase family protein [Candidatus Daviesbacteria bacterium]|nr:oligosaccharide flippase family protein [Candidatus Daviesbacteria bacterium]